MVEGLELIVEGLRSEDKDSEFDQTLKAESLRKRIEIQELYALYETKC